MISMEHPRTPSSCPCGDINNALIMVTAGEDDTEDKIMVLEEINKNIDGTIDGGKKARDITRTL